MNNPTILRWAGSKKQIIPNLSLYWQKSGASRYVEPFAGSARLFFSINPQKALLADINQELITTYNQIKKDWSSVYSLVSSFPKNKKYFYELRSIQPDEISNLNFRAARFIYLNRFCFNGLYRTNSLGRFNVPFGTNGSIPPEINFKTSSKLLKKVRLVSRDFEGTLKEVTRGDFVYMDPPFSVRNKNIFTDYDSSKFGLDDINRLKRWLAKLNKSGIPFLVSYLDSKEADMLAKGFYKNKVSVRRSIAGFTSNRRMAQEVLISNINTLK